MVRVSAYYTCQQHDTPPSDKIVYCYGEFQSSFAEFPTVEFQEGLPNVDQLDGRQRVLMIIDNLMNEVDQNVSNLFTKRTHHRNVSVVFITQNILHKKQIRPNDEFKRPLHRPVQESPQRRSSGNLSQADVSQEEQVRGGGI